MTTRTLYHGSSDKCLTEISEFHCGAVDFGGLFFGVEEVAGSHGEHLYECELDECDIATSRDLDNYWHEIVGLFPDVDEEELDAAVWDKGDSWECQILRGKIARKLGYSAVEMDDEHGTSWLVFPGTEIKRV